MLKPCEDSFNQVAIDICWRHHSFIEFYNYASTVWPARYTVGNMCGHCLVVSLHCRQHVRPLSGCIATLSAAYCHRLIVSLHCRQHVRPLPDCLSTLSAAYATSLIVALHCRHHKLPSSNCLATLSAAYVAVVRLTPYTVGIASHSLTSIVHNNLSRDRSSSDDIRNYSGAALDK